MRRYTPSWAWSELTRPRQLRRSAFSRARNQRSGVALLVAITTMLVLSVLVSELSYVARVRILVAYHQRDEAQAYWLARSGVNLYTLILMADKQIGNQLEGVSGLEEMGLDTLWQMVPVINTGLMRMLFTSGGDIDDFSEEELATFSQTGQVSDEVAAQSRDEGSSLFSDKNFLDFEGDFSAEVTDNEGKIDINQFDGHTGAIQDSATGQLLFSRMNSEEDEQWFLEKNIDRWEIIGNLADWIDADNIRSGGLGGYEDNLYNVQDPSYLAKNAKLDTFEEIRLIEGWQDEVFNRYAEDMTIWSNGKFNPSSFSREMHIAVITAYSEGWTQEQVDAVCFAGAGETTSLEEWGMAWYQMGGWKSAKEYAQDVQTSCGIEMDTSQMPKFTDKSRVFTVTSTGLVGTSQTTITAVLDYTRSNHGDVVYWRVD